MTVESPRSSVADALACRLRGRVVFVGIGNPMFGDDAAGCLLAQGLAATPGLAVVQADDVPESYVTKIADGRPDAVVLMDAVDLGAAPGSVAILEGETLARYHASTHRVPLGLIAEFIHRGAGADVFVLAIQPGQVQLGSDLSPAVRRTIDSLIELIAQVVPATDRTEAWKALRAHEVKPC